MKTTSLSLIAVCAFSLFSSSSALGHCQVPCGIFGDETRFTLLKEHVQTIEKSMIKIGELEKGQKSAANQLVRWVSNKDEHADKLSHIVTYYFLAQRVKVVGKEDAKGYAEYQQKLELLHQILVHSMQAKQTTDQTHVTKLNALLDQFRQLYLGPDADHGHTHH